MALLADECALLDELLVLLNLFFKGIDLIESLLHLLVHLAELGCLLVLLVSELAVTLCARLSFDVGDIDLLLSSRVNNLKA